MKSVFAIVAVGLAAVFIASQTADAATVNWRSTGVTTAGTPEAYGSDDSHYTVTFNGQTSQAKVINDHSRWVNPENPELNARWIGLTEFNTSDPVGTYTFTTEFNLTGFDPSTANMSFRYAVDNNVVVNLNGNEIASSTPIVGDELGYIDLLPLVTVAGSTGFFNSGINTLEFVVNNIFNNPQNHGNPMGLLVSGIGGTVSAVPVPAALPLLATAFAGLGFLSWRKRRKAA